MTWRQGHWYDNEWVILWTVLFADFALIVVAFLVSVLLLAPSSI